MDTAVEKTEPTKLGTFGGVFTPTTLTILGVIMFMRANFVIGQAGVLDAIVILCIAKAITFLTSLSISAIATNIQVRGGGSYFLISRVLGPEFGGAVGVSLFTATALSAPFYVIGFIEALVLTFPVLETYQLWIALGVTTLIGVVAFVGANWAIKVQYFIMTVLFLAIVVALGGSALNFDPELLQQNLVSGYTSLTNGSMGTYSFWLVFAIYFPAVTGIDAGLNMSGDLENPTKSLPWGTLTAVTVGFIVYLGQIFLAGGSFNRLEMIEAPFQILVDNALFGTGFLVISGVFAATLSSALGSILGAPRVLQALARDPILLWLRPFSKGEGENDEPQRALILTYILTCIILIWAYTIAGGDALNAIASLIAMFFLYTYGTINLAAFIEAYGRNPSFRPRFKFFHWISALVGGIGSISAAFLIDSGAAIIAAVLICGLIYYLFTKKTAASFGDARRGFVYTAVRNNLLRLRQMKTDAKNWRPTLLVFSGNPQSREAFVMYAIWLCSGRGIVLLVNIITSHATNLADRLRGATRQLDDFCTEEKIQAFPMVLAADDLSSGVSFALQSALSGLVKPNVAVFGWCEDSEKLPEYIQQLRFADELGLNIVIIEANEVPNPAWQKRVDIWWRGSTNGNLMMLLGYLLHDNWEWGKSTIQVLRSVNDKAGMAPALENLNEIIHDSRINAKAKVVLEASSFKETFMGQSHNSDCVFLGFAIPKEGEEQAWYQNYSQLIGIAKTTILIHSNDQTNILQ